MAPNTPSLRRNNWFGRRVARLRLERPGDRRHGHLMRRHLTGRRIAGGRREQRFQDAHSASVRSLV
jgi:hypothetical protein